MNGEIPTLEFSMSFFRVSHWERLRFGGKLFPEQKSKRLKLFSPSVCVFLFLRTSISIKI